ncbi:hypothetical protein BKA66DRAFT_572703 [Pyrenochaeta sp. MPI-SDFR-AT-0127]|nr:hypothetical protein BKA66DRAFT_572703 [Pyrenochaeta sp. MPI-SDFR-AT-0127]
MSTAQQQFIVVGGSLAGLMHGIMLRSLGHSVHIIEQADDIRESHMAGVCCAADCLEFLRRYDRISTPFSLKSERLQFVGSTGLVSHYFKAPRMVTSWDALYWRLRANFDGKASEYYPTPPPTSYEGAGEAHFVARHKVISIAVDGNNVNVTVMNLETGLEYVLRADRVIAADGPNSQIRQKYAPESQRKFTGYVAWRGTVPENEVSPEVLSTFQKNVTLNLMQDDHALVYIIPGETGSLEPGKRFLNFLWYTNETKESMDELMRDKNEHRHQYIVPAAHVRSEIWDKVLAKDHLLAPPHREVIRKIKRPFVQSITDFVSPRAVFEDGKILLVGDALSLYRPHTASSTNQAAFNCLAMERLIKGDIDAKEWEAEVLDFANLHCARSVWYGENYQRAFKEALPSALQYWGLGLMDSWRMMWYWKPSKLRW